MSKAQDLIEAIRAGDVEAVSALASLSHDSLDSSALGVTPLIAAAETGSLPIVKILLSHHADPSHATTSGNTPLRAAISGGDGECILELINAGAQVRAWSPTHPLRP